MPRGSDLNGLSVLAAPNYKRIGQVHEVLLSQDGLRICGLVLDDGGWFHPRRVLDYGAVHQVGETYLVADESYLLEEGQVRCCRDLHGLPVLRDTGEEVGVMDDFYFDPQTGQVTALQLSHGFVDDLLNGKSVVSLAGPVRAGEAAIMLDGPGDLSGGALS